MALSSYNGFTGAQRDRSMRWLNDQFAAGLARPCACQACGQTQGAMDYHTEDYSEPFGPHIHAFSLCYRCHIILHCRYRNPLAWNAYRDVVRAGGTFEAMPRSWGLFQRWLADRDAWTWHSDPARELTRTVLDEIHDGVYDPRNKPAAVLE